MMGKTGSKSAACNNHNHSHNPVDADGSAAVNDLQDSSESDDSATVTYNLIRSRDGTYDYILKMLVVGDCCTGKTCFVERICGNTRTGKFHIGYIPTIGIDFGVGTVFLDGKKLKIQVWDTSGSERFRTITRSYYRGSNGVFILFDVNKESSFYHCKQWLKEIEEHLPTNTVMLLIGSKCDIREEHYDTDTTSYVDYITAKKFADEHQLHYIEISSKDNTNVEFALVTMARLIMKHNKLLLI